MSIIVPCSLALLYDRHCLVEAIRCSWPAAPGKRKAFRRAPGPLETPGASGAVGFSPQFGASSMPPPLTETSSFTRTTSCLRPVLRDSQVGGVRQAHTLCTQLTYPYAPISHTSGRVLKLVPMVSRFSERPGSRLSSPSSMSQCIYSCPSCAGFVPCYPHRDCVLLPPLAALLLLP